MGDAARREAGTAGFDRRWRLASLAAALLALFLSLRLSGLSPSAASLSAWADGTGPAAIPIGVVVGVALSCAFVPFPLIAGAAGVVFGVSVGSGVALAVAVGASVAQMSVTRLVARLERRDGPPRRVHDRMLEQHGIATVFYTRLIPGLPYVPLNYAAGATRLRRRDMAVGALLASAPRSFAYAALGGSLSDLGAPEAKAAIAVLVAMAIIGVFVARRRGRGRWLELISRVVADALHGRPRQ